MNGIDVVQNQKRKQDCDRIKQCFEGSYDFSKQGDQMKMVEAMTEVGKALALTGNTATISFVFGNNGLTGVVVNNVPNEAPADINDT